MKTCKLLIILTFIALLAGCGVKADPAPSEAFFIPYPKEVSLSSADGGVLISNGSDTFPILVEVRKNTENMTNQDKFTRLTLVSPSQTFIDKDVTDGGSYSYRFSNYYTEYDTYSYPATKTITYKAPVQLRSLSFFEHDYNLCITAELNDQTEFAVLNMNGKDVGLLEGREQCVALPNVATIELLIIPYDKLGLQGTPHKETYVRDTGKILLPPQNVKLIRHNDRIVFSWDASLSNDAEYALYIVDNETTTLLRKTNITVESYKSDDLNRCIDFQLSSIRNGEESPRIDITSCP